MTVRTRTRTVAETDIALHIAIRYLNEALAYPWGVDPIGHALRCWGRVDALLEQRIELQRWEQGHFIEAWWCESWPGTDAPSWPQESVGEGA